MEVENVIIGSNAIASESFDHGAGSAASHAAGMSESSSIIGKLLGPAKIASTARYAHLDDGAVLEAAERVGVAI